MPKEFKKIAKDPKAFWYLFTAWLIALTASLFVLFIGEILGQIPCNLCWFQRSFMFPLVVLLGIAVWRMDFGIWLYGAPLAGAGLLISIYHTLLYARIIPEPIVPCIANGPTCTGEAMLIFGLPIPSLAVAAFSGILTLLLMSRK